MEKRSRERTSQTAPARRKEGARGRKEGAVRSRIDRMTLRSSMALFRLVGLRDMTSSPFKNTL